MRLVGVQHGTVSAQSAWNDAHVHEHYLEHWLLRSGHCSHVRQALEGAARHTLCTVHWMHRISLVSDNVHTDYLYDNLLHNYLCTVVTVCMYMYKISIN